MNKLNRLDPVRLLDAVARESASTERKRGFVFFVCHSDRAIGVLLDLQDLGWSISRPRREAQLPGCVIRVVVANRLAAASMRGYRIDGYMADEDVALDLDLRMALRPAMLGNAPSKAAANE